MVCHAKGTQGETRLIFKQSTYFRYGHSAAFCVILTDGEGLGMSGQQYTAQETSEKNSAENAREIANMDETDWMAMLVEMRILRA